MYLHYLIRTSGAPDGGFAPGFMRHMASAGLFAPVAPGLSAPGSLTVFGLVPAVVAVSIDDGGYAVPATVTVTATKGTVASTLLGGVTVSGGAMGTSHVSLVGARDGLNATLATLTYTSIIAEGVGSVSVTVVNGVGLSSAETIPVSIALLPQPSLSAPGFVEAMTAQPTGFPVIAITSTDRVRLAVSAGILTVSLNDRATISDGANGSPMFQIDGDTAALQDVLRSLMYTSATGFSGVDTLQIVAEHQAGTSASATTAIIVQPESLGLDEPDDMLWRILENTGRLYGG